MIVRSATIEDAADIAGLMSQLGYTADISLIEDKLREFSGSGTDIVFVAELENEVAGCISCHITSLFHQKGNSGRITSLVIDRGKRRMGIGRALVAEAEEFFRAKGCIKSEVTSGSHRLETHKFYESLGFQKDEPRFIKKYS